MPVQVFPSDHGAKPIDNSYGNRFVDDPLELLTGAWPDSRFHELLQTSFTIESKPPSSAAVPLSSSTDGIPPSSTALSSSTNGLVYAIIQAYSSHHHLRIRPEDVWVAVLTQLSLYINAHADKPEVRSKLVKHKEGKKELRITCDDASDRYNVDYGRFAQDMAKLLENHVVDSTLREWMMPCFSTTTPQDQVVASIVMMGSLQKYFDYKCYPLCGFPSVTLLGEKADYVLLLKKLDKLKTFGDEPKMFSKVLKPVVKRFIQTFDNPQAKDVMAFWKRAMYYDPGMCGVELYSGWMTAFCFWDEDGKCLYNLPKHVNSRKYSETADFGYEIGDPDLWGSEREPLYLKLDGVKYHSVDSKDFPPGWCKVPVKIIEGGEVTETEMVAGSVAIACSSSGAKDENGVAILDTMQPETGWWIYAKIPGEHPDLVEARKKGLALNIPKGVMDQLIVEARSHGRPPSDQQLDMYAKMFTGKEDPARMRRLFGSI